MLSQATQAVRKGFTPESDLSNAYIVREGQRMLVNIADLIYRMDFSKDMELKADDIVIIPFRQFFVSVSGAVKIPGRYPYIPDRSWEYYVGLAGGIDAERNSGSTVSIMDVTGKKKAKTQSIEPEDAITAPANSFLYFFGRTSAILMTIISVASLVVSLSRL
jgi:polysaccharide export outer membrane protein